MKREEEQQLISSLSDVFKKAKLVVVVHNNGLSMEETTALRKGVREDGASYKVAKNRLAKLALAGTPCESLADLLKGPTGIAYSEDEIAASKAVVKMAKQSNKFKVIGGVMNGQAIVVASIQQLASLPDLYGLRAQLIGLLQAPAGQLDRLAKAYSEKAE